MKRVLVIQEIIYSYKHFEKQAGLLLYLDFLSVDSFPSGSASISSVGLCGSERGKAVFRVSTIAFTTICKVIKKLYVKSFSQNIQWAFLKVPCQCVKQWRVSSQRQFLHQCLEREILAFHHCWPFQERHKVAVIKENMNKHLEEVMWDWILTLNILMLCIQITYSKECFQKTFPGLDFVTVHVSKWKLGKYFLWSFHIYS